MRRGSEADQAAAPTAAGAVALEGVTKRYGAGRGRGRDAGAADAAAVADLSIAVAPGEFFTLLGPSGSGKSTTLSLVAGFETPDRGRILLGGQDMTRAPPRVRGLGMVFQNYAIFPHLDVFENVAFPLRARRADRATIQTRVAEALEAVRLTGLERRGARQLSGGQQQRVALARAIVARPRIVLMDEPLGALDKNLRYQVQTEIKDLQRRLGMTVLFVTHDQEEAMNLSDRIAILDGGRLAQAGPPREVYERPDTAFVARFLGEANLIPGMASGNLLRMEGGVVLRAANTLTIPGPASLFVRPEKLALCAPAGGQDSRAPDGGGWNRLAGRVRRVSFLGNVVRAELETAAGAGLLTVDMVNGPGGDAPALRGGEEVTTMWPAEECRLLAAT